MIQPIPAEDLFPAVPLGQNVSNTATDYRDLLNIGGPGGYGTGGITYPEIATGHVPDVNIPDVQQSPLDTTSIPVPDTTQLGATPLDTPGRAYTAENTDFEGLAARAPGVTPEQTVQGQLTSLFSNRDANPLWQYAQGVAQQYANSRGLLNSDIAAEAGAQAVFAQAMPIAQQDANTFAVRAQQEAAFWQTAGLQAQQATIVSGLQAQAHLEQMTQFVKQGDINSRLQLEQFGYNFQLNEQQNLHNMQLAALQGDIQSELALQQFGFNSDLMRQDYGYRLTLMDQELRDSLRIGAQQQDYALDQIAAGHANTLEQIAANADAQGGLAEEGFARDLQQNYLLAVERRTQQFSAEVQSIYSQQGLTSYQQTNAVNVARRNYLTDLDFIKSQYSSSPYWDNSWTASPGSTPGAPPPTPTPTPDDVIEPNAPPPDPADDYWNDPFIRVPPTYDPDNPADRF